jgi:transcriptional regulator with XRE-family HTH domain
VGRNFTRGTKLAERMDLLGYSVKDIATGTGIDRFMLNDYLNRRKPISPRHMMRLCAFLKCSAESLTD